MISIDIYLCGRSTQCSNITDRMRSPKIMHRTRAWNEQHFRTLFPNRIRRGYIVAACLPAYVQSENWIDYAISRTSIDRSAHSIGAVTTTTIARCSKQLKMIETSTRSSNCDRWSSHPFRSKPTHTHTFYYVDHQINEYRIDTIKVLVALGGFDPNGDPVNVKLMVPPLSNNNL